ncbi:MAG: 3-hydroxyacyl-CoA dehydrogenase NAD-binding domain-containing protein [Candidatus Acidiferrales bacterium]|jgi:3-hydroxybutyryl-CoA dehydrogenase
MKIESIAVIGAGSVGRGIAYAVALGGFRTMLEDVSASTLEQGMAYIRDSLDDGVARGTVTAEARDQALARISTSSVVEEACRQGDLLIEAVPEDVETKLEIFTLFDKFARPAAIFASTTSSLSVSETATITFCPERCIGMHFFNPVPKLKLLEIVRALETSDETLQACVEAGRRMAEDVVVVKETLRIIASRIKSADRERGFS